MKLKNAIIIENNGEATALDNDTRVMIANAPAELREEVTRRGLRYHHTAWARGYISRKKPEGEWYEYRGRFGRGIAWVTPSWQSTQYYHITYFTV